MESSARTSSPRPVADPPATLRILALADLGAKEPLGPLAVDKSSLPDLLARLAPSVTVEVPDHLTGERRELACTLAVSELKAFTPDAVAAAVPELAALREVRTRVAKCADGRADAEALRTELPTLLGPGFLADAVRAALDRPAAPAATPPPADPGGGALDDLLSKVEVPGAPPGATPARQLADALVESLVPGEAGPNRVALERVAAELDSRLTRQVAAILASEPVRRLEASWRGLKHLVDRLDFRAPVRLEVLSAPAEELLEEFYERVFAAEYAGDSEVPLSLVIAELELGRGADDLEAARAAARLGESLQVPFVVAAGPEYWGIRQLPLLATLPDLAGRCRGSEYAKWNAFRTEPASLWLTVVVNRFLGRPLWGDDASAVKSFAWSTASGVADPPLWCSPVWAAAAVAGQGYAEAGLRFPMAGPTPPAVLEELPLRTVAGRGEPVMSPLEAQLSEERVVDLADAGFAALFGRANRDSAHFRWVPAYHAPARFQEPEATRASYLEATLSYELIAGAVAHLVRRIARTVSPSEDRAVVQGRFRDALLALLATAEDAPEAEEVTVEVAAEGEDPRQVEVIVRVRPRFPVEGGTADLVLGSALGRAEG